jgi:tetratricopeptide (TPR) repeat protein
MIVCKVCGEKIESAANYCPNCGAIIEQSKGIKVSKDADQLNETKQKRKEKISKLVKGKIKKSVDNKSTPKIISFNTLLYMILPLAIIGGVILYYSGTFDSAPTSSDAVANISDNPHAGADLNKLRQITEFEDSLRQNPNDSQLLLQLAHLLNDSGFKEKAIEKYNDYLKTDPKNADVMVDRGVCYYEVHKYEDAINSMESALKFQPKHQIAQLNLGIVNMAVGNNEKALEWWNKAIQTDPTSEVGKKAKELIKSHQ